MDDAHASTSENKGAHGRSRLNGWRRTGIGFMGLLGLLLLVLLAIWTQRTRIADNMIARELAAVGVTAQYDVAQIGGRTQRLENVVLGDPARPDFTASSVEIDIGYAGLAPAVRAIRVDGGRLRVDLRGGEVSFGVLDALIPKRGGGSGLPAINAGITDGRVSVLTDFGTIGVAIAGQGRLDGGFSGKVVAVSRQLRHEACTATAVNAAFGVSTARNRIRIDGPIGTRQIDCDALLEIAAPTARVAISATDDLQNWTAKGRVMAGAMRSGGLSAPSLASDFNVAGTGEQIGGTIDALVADPVIDTIRAGSVRFNGRLASSPATGPGLDGRLSIMDAGAAASGRQLLPVAPFAATPLAPIVAATNQAIARAGRDNLLTMTVAADRNSITLRDGVFAAQSGLRIVGSRDLTLRWTIANGGWGGRGGILVSGGGLPDGMVRFAGAPTGAVSGDFRFDRFAANGAALAVGNGRFRVTPKGQSFVASDVLIDGPVGDGQVSGLMLPIDVAFTPDGAVSLRRDCAPIRWSALSVGAFRFGKQAVSLCGGASLRIADGVRGRLRTGPVTISGTNGTTAVSIDAARLGYDLGGSSFDAESVSLAFGDRGEVFRLAAGLIAGKVGGEGLTGILENGSARIGAVPIAMSAIDGGWRFAEGVVAFDGAMRIADTQADERFNPALVTPAKLQLASGVIDAEGILRNPGAARDFGRFAIRHRLDDSSGEARIFADDGSGGINFGSALQPDDLTTIALGVIANVTGRVTGEGVIGWTASGVTSGGAFEVSDMNFAAAFGPVQGFATRIQFDDLLALRTAPDQRMTIANVSSGIDVQDGEISYSLTGDARAAINWGRWPFAGGTLELLPTTLDFSAEKDRRLAFRVVGMDAGALINTMELENLSATGTFDGLLPMVFDAQGGRIVGGLIVARQSGRPPLVLQTTQSVSIPCDADRAGGTLSYVGAVSNAQLGTFGKLAFDALKNLRYKCLSVVMDGALDDEIVTQIAFNGVNQGTVEVRRSFLTRPFVGLPFLFNIKIEAPFRGLLGTYRSFTDPSLVIRNAIEAEKANRIENRLVVQPVESDKTVAGDKK